MSQTTRCPACQTRFKVVADQLRISDGWVRCGSCQQVFDASLSLQPTTPEPMLPNMPLDELRGPVDRAEQSAAASHGWGDDSASSAAGSLLDSSAEPENTDQIEESDKGFAHTEPGGLYMPADDAVDDLSNRAVPSFLKAPAPPEPAFLSSKSMRLAAIQTGFYPMERAPVHASLQDEGRMHADAKTFGAAPQDPWPAPRARLYGSTEAGLQPAHSGGYEPPDAQFDEADSEWPALFDEMPADATQKVEAVSSADRGDAPELDLAHFIAETATINYGNVADSDPETLPSTSPSGALQEAVEVSLEVADDIEDSDWALVQDDTESAYTSLVHDGHLSPSQGPQVLEQIPVVALDGAGEAIQPEIELSFVRRARRRAFWSGNGVRLGLTLIATGLLVGLLAQIAFRERARLAATWPQSRPLLESACVHLQCSVGMYRDIGAVLVDGSAFNHVQGGRYQFSLTLKNRAVLSVEAPAIELTLTDAENQPMLRRILLPVELAVPNPLRPGQEWSAVAPITLDLGTARVAGYRVLAFYP